MNKKYILVLLTIIMLCAACHKKSIDEHNHGSNHHEPTITKTLFKNGFELFVDFTVPVTNENFVLYTHITKLENYKPVSEGQLTVSLIQGAKGIRNHSEKPVKPGVFETTLQPKTSGIAKLQFDYEINGTRTTFIIDSQMVFGNHEEAHYIIPQFENDNQITFLKEQAWRADFGITQIAPGDFREVIHTSGKLLPANGDENTIVAPFTGIVSLSQNTVPGAQVKKGRSLLELSGKGLASDNIQVHYNQIKTDYEKAKADFERAQQLVDEKIVSQKDYIAAKTDYEQAKVAYENIRYAEDGSINKVTASLSGFIKDVLVNDGEFVVAGTPLVIIAENKRLILQADVSQRHWHCLPEITEANFLTPYNSDILNTKQLNGKLLSYSRNAANSAWSTPVFFEIKNNAELIPGTYVEIYLLSKTKSNSLVIPKSALVEEQGNYFVFVQLNGESYEKRLVKTGQTNGSDYEVLSGINEGEYIVTRGAYHIKLASVSSTLPAHDHEH